MAEYEEPLIYNSLLKKEGQTKHKWVHIVAGVTVFAIMGMSPAVYFYNKYTQTQKLVQNPGAVAKEKEQEVIDKVGAHVDLPKGERPSIATVSNKEKLAGQPFFDKAENGDKVLIYENAKKAYIYRPSTDRVVNIAPIINPFGETVASEATGEGEVAAEATASADVEPLEAPISIMVYNGTGTSGLARKMSAQIEELVAAADTSTGNAESADYQETIVVDVDGSNKAEIGRAHV